MKDFKTLGWREWVGFPDLDLRFIKAKIDTGARTSALHAFMVEPFMRGSQQWVRFAIHPVQRDSETAVECEAPVKDKRLVRDSGGHEELRYVIETRIRIGVDIVKSEVTLTDRDTMKFRVLLGRTAMRKGFVVNPARSYLMGKRPRVLKDEKTAS